MTYRPEEFGICGWQASSRVPDTTFMAFMVGVVYHVWFERNASVHIWREDLYWRSAGARFYVCCVGECLAAETIKNAEQNKILGSLWRLPNASLAPGFARWCLLVREFAALVFACQHNLSFVVKCTSSVSIVCYWLGLADQWCLFSWLIHCVCW